jgi:hypothetical protein
MSNDKLFTISNGYILHCGINGWGVLMEKGVWLITDILPVTHPEIKSC